MPVRKEIAGSPSICLTRSIVALRYSSTKCVGESLMNILINGVLSTLSRDVCISDSGGGSIPPLQSLPG